MEFYLKNLSFCSYIDSYFNYLRKVDLYKRESSRVIKVYYSALQSIVSNIGAFNKKMLMIKEFDVMNRKKKYVKF